MGSTYKSDIMNVLAMTLPVIYNALLTYNILASPSLYIPISLE